MLQAFISWIVYCANSRALTLHLLFRQKKKQHLHPALSKVVVSVILHIWLCLPLTAYNWWIIMRNTIWILIRPTVNKAVTSASLWFAAQIKFEKIRFHVICTVPTKNRPERHIKTCSTCLSAAWTWAGSTHWAVVVNSFLVWQEMMLMRVNQNSTVVGPETKVMPLLKGSVKLNVS